MDATKKKLIISVALMLLTALTFSYGTYAYFTDSVSAGTTIRAGSFELFIRDTTLPDGGASIPGAATVRIMPGTSVTKNVRLRNEGNSSAYIRIKPILTVALAEQNRGRESEIDLSLISLDIDGSLWLERDGYYYYHKALRPGEWAESFYRSISFHPDMGKLYMESTVTVTMNIYAVQANGNASSPLEAAGWPAEQNGGAP